MKALPFMKTFYNKMCDSILKIYAGPGPNLSKMLFQMSMNVRRILLHNTTVIQMQPVTILRVLSPALVKQVMQEMERYARVRCDSFKY